MLTAIVKRECLDHLFSLRFSFALVLVLGLMVLNALGFAGGTYASLPRKGASPARDPTHRRR